MSKACVFFADGLEECEALIVVDVLRRAGVRGGRPGRVHAACSEIPVKKADGPCFCLHGCLIISSKKGREHP